MVNEFVESDREDYWTLPRKNVEDGAAMLIMGGALNDRVVELEARVDNKNDLEEGKGVIRREMFEDVGGTNG